MKFFTPELFIKLQECDSPGELRAVNQEWERAVKQYGNRLQEITSHNEELRRFVKGGSLHDARVLDIGTTERRIMLVVQEEFVRALLVLTYSLVEAPVIERNAFPEQHRTPHALWLYDELEVDPEMVFHAKRRIQKKATAVSASDVGKEEWKPIFLHSILLSNGWEIRLRFHRLAETRTTSLLHPDRTLPRSEDSLSCSA
jgi:hypothetical protein